jgi:hypothetical protein
MTPTKTERSRAAKAEVEPDETTETEEQEVEEPGEAERGPSGPTQTPVEVPEPVQPATVPAAAPEEEEAAGAAVDDGVADVSLGPPVLGGWVRITGGDYAGRFAAYLGNVKVDPDAVPMIPTVIQVRTRDADNLVLDVPYEDVASTMYSGGR